MIPDRIEQTKDELLMQFVANCIQWAADATGVDYLTMFRRLDKADMIDKYLMEFYDVLHCESRQNVVNDILETLNTWENYSKPHINGNS